MMGEILLPIPGARVSQHFGEHPEIYAFYSLRGHNGVDLASPKPLEYLQWHGTPVQAVGEGEAIWAWDPSGFGLYVYVYGGNCDWLYAHLSVVKIKNGQRVEIGQIIGNVGYTGNTQPSGAMGTHLHWGMRPRPLRLDNGYRGYEDPLRGEGNDG